MVESNAILHGEHLVLKQKRLQLSRRFALISSPLLSVPSHLKILVQNLLKQLFYDFKQVSNKGVLLTESITVETGQHENDLNNSNTRTTSNIKKSVNFPRIRVNISFSKNLVGSRFQIFVTTVTTAPDISTSFCCNTAH